MPPKRKAITTAAQPKKKASVAAAAALESGVTDGIQHETSTSVAMKGESCNFA